MCIKWHSPRFIYNTSGNILSIYNWGDCNFREHFGTGSKPYMVNLGGGGGLNCQKGVHVHFQWVHSKLGPLLAEGALPLCDKLPDDPVPDIVVPHINVIVFLTFLLYGFLIIVGRSILLQTVPFILQCFHKRFLAFKFMQHILKKKQQTLKKKKKKSKTMSQKTI